MANQKNQGNQLKRITLTESQKKQLEVKFQRVRNELLKRKIVKSERELNNYSTYKNLNDYEQYCLLGNNYWVIMNGEYDRFVSVPITDHHFWYYFNETCFIECEAFQRRKKIEREEKLFKIDDEFKAPEPIKKELTIEPEPIKEQIIEPEKVVEIKKEPEPIIDKKKEDEMPIEENKDFLNQKQEHPKYDKEEIKKRMEGIKAESAEKTESELKKKVEDKKTKKIKKGKNDDQVSLF